MRFHKPQPVLTCEVTSCDASEETQRSLQTWDEVLVQLDRLEDILIPLREIQKKESREI